MFIDDKDKLVEVVKKKDVEINKVNMEKSLVGGVLIRSDEPDLEGWITPYEVTEDTAHDYMENCQVLGYMHGDIRNLNDDGIGFEVPGATKYASVVDSMFFSQEVIDMVKNGDIKAGDWFLVARVHDEKVKEQIENGEIKSFSIAGKALIPEEDDDA